MSTDSTHSASGFGGDRFGFRNGHQHPPKGDALDALVSLSPEDANKEVHRHAQAKWAEDPKAVEERERAAAEVSYYENVQKQQEADRARWAQEQADAPLTELHVAGAIEWSWKNLPELFQLAIYGTIAGAIFAAEVGNGTVLIRNSGSALGDSLIVSMSLAFALIGTAFMWANHVYNRASEEEQAIIDSHLRRYGLYSILAAFLLFGALFGGSHGQVSALSGSTEQGGTLVFKAFTALSLLLLMLSLIHI